MSTTEASSMTQEQDIIDAHKSRQRKTRNFKKIALAQPRAKQAKKSPVQRAGISGSALA